MQTRDFAARPRRAGLAVVALLAPLLVGLAGCTIPVRVGDPEHAPAEPGLAGVWLANPEGGEPVEYAAALYIVEPLTRGNWLVTVVGFSDREQPEDNAKAGAAESTAPRRGASIGRILDSLGEERAKPESEIVIFHAWLTTLGGEHFLVLEPMASPDVVAAGLRRDAWIVLRFELGEDRGSASLVKPDFDNLKHVKSRSEAEAIIAKHAREPGLYGDRPLLFARVPWSRYPEVAQLMKRVGLDPH